MARDAGKGCWLPTTHAVLVVLLMQVCKCSGKKSVIDERADVSDEVGKGAVGEE